MALEQMPTWQESLKIILLDLFEVLGLPTLPRMMNLFLQRRHDSRRGLSGLM